MGGMQNPNAEQNFPSLQPDPANSMPAPVQINSESDPKPGADGEEQKAGEAKSNPALVHQ